MSIRSASSIILKDGDRVFLVRRSSRLKFFGDFWACPGGTVDAEDRFATDPGSTAEDRSATDPASTADDEFLRAAVRELFEESGIELWPPLPPKDASAWRKRLIEGAPNEVKEFWAEVDLAGFERLRVEVDGPTGRRPSSHGGSAIRPIARLLTPSYQPRRYDTQFYLVDLAQAPKRDGRVQRPEVWPGELEEGEWDEPSAWLDRWRRGEVKIAPPVILMLFEIATHGWEGSHERFRQLTARFREGRIHTIFHNPAAQLLPMRTRTLPPAEHTNAYLVGTDSAYLVDPGPDDPDEQERLLEILRLSLENSPIGVRHLKAILLTHHHNDHIGAVDRIRKEFGVPVLAHPATAERLEGRISIDRLLEEGDRLPLGRAPSGHDGWELEVLHTPGHAPGHVCFLEREYGSLFIGDMASPLSSVLVRRKDGTMRDYMTSLRRLSEVESEMIYPAHGPAVPTATGLLPKQIAHREERSEAIAESVGNGARRVEDVVDRVYVELPDEARPFAMESVASVLDMLVENGRIEVDEDGNLSAVDASE